MALGTPWKAPNWNLSKPRTMFRKPSVTSPLPSVALKEMCFRQLEVPRDLPESNWFLSWISSKWWKGNRRRNNKNGLIPVDRGQWWYTCCFLPIEIEQTIFEIEVCFGHIFILGKEFPRFGHVYVDVGDDILLFSCVRCDRASIE